MVVARREASRGVKAPRLYSLSFPPFAPFVPSFPPVFQLCCFTVLIFLSAGDGAPVTLRAGARPSVVVYLRCLSRPLARPVSPLARALARSLARSDARARVHKRRFVYLRHVGGGPDAGSLPARAKAAPSSYRPDVTRYRLVNYF